MLKLPHNALISHASKVMLKILQARLQRYVNRELPHVQTGFRKGRGTRDQIANICWVMEKAREFQKKTPPSTYASLTMQKPLCGSQQTGKFFNRWKYQTTLHISWETSLWIKKQQLEPYMEQEIVRRNISNLRYAVFCDLGYMQSTSCRMQGWMKHKLDSRLPGEITMTSDMQRTMPLWRKVKRNWRTSWWR